MAKQKAKRPESKTVTLATGTKVTGPVGAVDKMLARARSEVRKAPAPAPAVINTPTQGAEKPPAPEDPKPVNDTPVNLPERPSRGASLAAWAEFAKAAGFEYPEGASRDEIRDAYEAAHPAE